jgi:hypothetical protein
MSAHFKIYHARRVVLSVSTGTVTSDDLRAQSDELVQEPGFDPTYRQLWDPEAR